MMEEQLLYLSLLLTNNHDQYILSLARGLVCKQYKDISQQEIQESFEELATCIRWNLSLLDQSRNQFAPLARQWLREH